VILGPARSLLTAERTALNFLQRLSGVATLTARYAGKLAGTGVRVLDTRKTTPGYRALEKHAVRMGGGWNHRQGLHDMILIKDNHIVAAGGVAEAIGAAAAGRPGGIAIEVEVAALADLDAALDPAVDGILLDNMTPAEVARAVARIAESPHRPWIEISGGVSLETIGDYAIPGVDFISIGRLTHSAPALDLALDFEFDAGAGGNGP
jgi:nicotinate-nucleotide pyrophosphorylase (carboxylating)